MDANFSYQATANDLCRIEDATKGTEHMLAIIVAAATIGNYDERAPGAVTWGVDAAHSQVAPPFPANHAQ